MIVIRVVKLFMFRDSKITFLATGPNLCPSHFGQLLPSSNFHQSPLAGKSSFIQS